MNIEEIVGAVVGVIMVVTLSVCLIAVVIIYAKECIEGNRKKTAYKELQKKDMNCYVRAIAQELYEINKTLNRKDKINNEKR